MKPIIEQFNYVYELMKKCEHHTYIRQLTEKELTEARKWWNK